MQDADLDSVNDGLAEAMASIPRDEPAEAEPGGDAEAAAEDQAGQARDERGRFARQEEPEKAAAAAEGKESGKGSDDDRDGGMVPSWRMREIREERDAERREREAERRELEALRRQRAEWLRQQEAQREQPQRPDPMADPEGYEAYMEQRMAARENAIIQQFRADRLNASFADLEEKMIDQGKGEVFTSAYDALERAPEDIRNDVFRSVNPGRAMMRWYNRQLAIAEIGDDFDGFRAKERQRLMADPEFRKEFMAAMEAEARGNSAERSSTNVTDLPSVNRIPGGGGRQTPGSLGGSDREIFASLTARR